MNTEAVIRAVRTWVTDLVIAERLCPFASQPLAADSVRFATSAAVTEEALLDAVTTELRLLLTTPEIETTLLIHPRVLNDFPAYNQFLDVVDALLVELDLEGVIQVASFHPEYQFAGTGTDDAENYSNRSPYPMLHLLREAGVEAAIRGYPEVGKVPERNICHLRNIGTETLARRLKDCFQDSGESVL